MTSAAGGPAFDTSQVHAACRPNRAPSTASIGNTTPPSCNSRVIGGGEAKGTLRLRPDRFDRLPARSGDLTRTGRFAAPEDVMSYREQQPAIRLSPVDVDMFQRAKAAIGVGIKTLLARAEWTWGNLRRICVGGVFGQHLNCRHAQAVGLLPDVPPCARNSAEIRPWPDASGCCSRRPASADLAWLRSADDSRQFVASGPNSSGCFWKASGAV